MKILREILSVFQTRLGRKLLLPVLIVVALFSVPLILINYDSYVVDKTSAEVADRNEAIENLDQMEVSLKNEQVNAYGMIFDYRTDLIPAFQTSAGQTQFWHDQAMQNADEPDEIAALTECQTIHDRVLSTVNSQIIPVISSTHDHALMAPVEDQLQSDFTRMSELRQQVKTDFENNRQNTIAVRTEAREFASEMTWTSIIAAMLLGVLVAGITIRRLVIPIRNLAEASLQIARGDLTQRIEVKGNDELANASHNFNDMADSLERRTEQLEQEKARIRSIHQSIGDGIIVVDRGGSIISINPAAERALGKPAVQLERTTNTGVPELQQALARNISEAEMFKCWEVKDCHKTDCPSHGSADRRCWLQCGTFCYNQIQGTFKQKRDACERCDVFLHNAAAQFEIEMRGRHYSTQMVPILDDTGQEEGRTIVLHDITDLQRAKEEVERSATQLGVLNSVSKAASSSLELDTILSTSLTSILGGTMADAAFIHTLDPETGDLTLVASTGLEDELRGLITRIPEGQDCPGHVVKTGEAILESNLSEVGEAACSVMDAGFFSYVGAPLKVKKGNTGVISLLSTQAGAFNEEDKRLVSLIGNQIGVAMDNAMLFNQSMEHALREQAKSGIIASLTSSLELGAVYEQFVNETRNLVDFDRISIIRIVDEANVEMVASSGIGPRSLVEAKKIRIADTTMQWMLGNEAPYMSGDITKEKRFLDHRKLGELGLRSQLCLPLVVKGKMLGSLNLASRQLDAYSNEDIDELGPVADQVALALDNQKLFEDVARAKTEWETTFDSVSEGIVIVGTDHKIMRLNKAGASMLGGEISDLTGRRCYEVIHKLYSEPDGCPMNAAGVNSAPSKREQTTPDGRTLELVVDTMFDKENNKIGAVHFLRDITESKRLRMQLLQSEKMVAVGQLVSGVAHEINNPLTGVAGYAQLLLAGDIDDKTRKDAEAIYAEAERATRIVRQLLSFARKHQPERSAVNINRVLEESLALKAYDLKVNNIEAETYLDEDIPLTDADPHQLQQIFLNLITNAEQAMLETNGAGLLKVTTKNANGGGMIRVVFSDNGPGIPKEISDRIFDPFFTTKEVGKGTGLGLSVCFGVVQDHGGRIWPEASAEGGASMIVELPVISGGARSAGAVSRQPFDTRRLGRILLVDDEESIREVITKTLKRVGHSVDTADNGNVALSMLKQTHYDCIVSDIKMPGMNGKELHQAVRDLDPDLAGSFVFISGDTVNPETKTYLSKLKNPFLSKPFELDELERVLQKVLASGTRKHG